MDRRQASGLPRTLTLTPNLSLSPGPQDEALKSALEKYVFLAVIPFLYSLWTQHYPMSASDLDPSNGPPSPKLTNPKFPTLTLTLRDP